MHRRAHGGAWSAAVLMIGCCSASFAAEPRLASGYSSGTATTGGLAATGGTMSTSVGTSNVSTFVPHTSPTSPVVSTSPVANSASSASMLGAMTPIGSDSAASARAIEIVPTPLVPYASVLAQQGRVFSPSSVANVPPATLMVGPNSLGLPTSPGWIPKDPSRAAIAPFATAPTAPVVDSAAATSMPISAPLVPVILPAAEKALLEKALLGASAPSEVATKADAVATSPSKADVAPVETVSKTVAEPVLKSPPIAEEVAVASPARITPLPPLEREVASPPLPSMNLPQPPIPLEYPRTGR